MIHLKSYFALTFVLLVLFSCNNGLDPLNNPYSDGANAYESESPLSEEELKQQLLMKECSNSSSYLSGTLSYKPIYKNLLSLKVNGIKLECDLRNNASIATFKDVTLNLEFKSKTGSTVVSRDVTIYELISPNSTINYTGEIEITNQEYLDIEEMKWSIKSANCK